MLRPPMRWVQGLLILLAVAALPACSCSAFPTNLRFACTAPADCAPGFSCRGGECQTTMGGGGQCSVGEAKVCPVAGCVQSCGTDGGLQECAPLDGPSFASNPDHCGECGRACAKSAGQTCVNNHCTCLLDSDCPPGDVCAPGGLCVNGGDPCASLRCPAGQACRSGICAAVACTAGCGAIEVCDPSTSRCRAVDQCRVPVTCDAGLCEGAARAAGAACNDNNACSFGETCNAAGACSGTVYSCPAPTACQVSVACAGDGGCLVVDKADGMACDDGKVCTSNDVCTGLVCGGAVGTTYFDGDGDGRGDTALNAMTCPEPAGYVSLGADCDDNDAGVYQVQMVARDLDQDGTTLTTTIANECVGASSVVSGRTYYSDTALRFSWLGTASTVADCLDSDGDVFQMVSVIEDTDQDGWGASGSPVTNRCVGATSVVDGRTYYASLTGAFTWLAAAGNLGADCNDANTSVKGPTSYYADGDGDGFGTGTAVVACTAPMMTATNNTDCDDASAFVNINRTVFDDTDQDGFTQGAAATQCTGVTSTVSGRTYYRAVSGAYTWITTSLGSDCDDAVAAVNGPTDWFADADSDTYGTGAATSACTAPLGKPASNATDCNDASANVFTNRSVYLDGDQDGYTDGAVGTQCTGSTSTVNGRTYFRNSAGAFTWIATSLGGDCNTSSALLFQTVNNLVADDDRDGYPPTNNQVSACVGASSTINGRTYYAASAAANDYLMEKADCLNYQVMMGGNCLAPFDCYDSNASAAPGQTAYFVTNRGDGSYDYDCSGTTTSNAGLATYCVTGGTATFFTDAACTMGSFTATRCTSTPATTYPAACSQFGATNGAFYDVGGVCTASARRSATQIGCR